MDFLGLGPEELILVLIIIFIVMGPGKIVKISRDLGKMVSSFRKASSELTAQVTKELEIEEKKETAVQPAAHLQVKKPESPTL